MPVRLPREQVAGGRIEAATKTMASWSGSSGIARAMASVEAPLVPLSRMELECLRRLGAEGVPA